MSRIDLSTHGLELTVMVQLTCDQGTPGVQSDYIGIRAGGDAICIAYLAVTQNDQAQGSAGMWNGDIGAACGVQWVSLSTLRLKSWPLTSSTVLWKPSRKPSSWSSTVLLIPLTSNSEGW